MRHKIPLPLAPIADKERSYKFDDPIKLATPEQAAVIVQEATAWLRTLMTRCCAKEHENPLNESLTNQSCTARDTNLLCGHLRDVPVKGKVLVGKRLSHVIDMACALGLLTKAQEMDLRQTYDNAAKELSKLDDIATGGYRHFSGDPQYTESTADMRLMNFRARILPLLQGNPTKNDFRKYVMREEAKYAKPMQHVRDKLLLVLGKYDPAKSFRDLRRPGKSEPAKPERKRWHKRLLEKAWKILAA